jgi:hypothetical protein
MNFGEEVPDNYGNSIMEQAVRKCGLLLCVGMIVCVVSCGKCDFMSSGRQMAEEDDKTYEPEGREKTMKLTSDAFKNDGRIPVRYTCDGEDISPPLSISDVPESAESLALVMDDPDAPMGTFDHWIVWNIPVDTISIAEGEQPEGVPGRNDFGNLGYGGPCPPSGTHVYRFKLYALDTMLELEEGATKEELQVAMEGHIVERDILRGRYSR